MALFFFTGGLYEIEPYYSSLLLLFILTILTVLYRIIRQERWHWSATCLAVIPLLYLPFFHQLESTNDTWVQFIRMAAYASFFFLLLTANQKVANNQMLPNSFTSFSYVILVSTYIGIAGFFSISHFWLILSEDISGLGMRLGSFLQYPNAFAILCVALFLFHGLQVVQQTSPKWRFIHLAPLLPYLLLILLTESRGALLVLLLAVLLSIFMLQQKDQSLFLISMLASGLLAIVLYRFSWLLNSYPAVYILITVITGSVFSVVMGRWGNFNFHWKSQLLMPLGATVLFAAVILDILFQGLLFKLLPTVLQSRLAMGSGTLEDRFLYISDAWRASDQFLWFGAGGNAWKSFMYQVQTSPYISHEVHSSIMGSWMEVGLIGLLIIGVLFISALYQMFRLRSLHVIPFLAIIVHSFFDFTLSYGLLVFVLFYFFVLAVGEPTTKKGSTINNKKFLTYGSTGLLLIVMTIGSIYAFRFQQAEQAYVNGEVNQALRWNPYKMEYNLALKGSITDLERGLQYEPHHAYAIYQLASLYREDGNTQKTLVLYRQAVKLDSFDAYKHEGYIEYLLEIGEIEQAKKAYAEYKKLGSRPFPTNNQRNFHLTDKTIQMMEEIQ